MLKFHVEQVKSVYNGKAHACCCGCAGVHSTTPTSIKRAVNKINKAIKAGQKVDVEGSYAAIENETRQTIIYFS